MTSGTGVRMKKRDRQRLQERLCDVDDWFPQVIAFVRVIGKASQAPEHSTPDDSILWLAHEIEQRLDDIRTEIDLVRNQLLRNCKK